jgi:hypothetical protein
MPEALMSSLLAVSKLLLSCIALASDGQGLSVLGLLFTAWCSGVLGYFGFMQSFSCIATSASERLDSTVLRLVSQNSVLEFLARFAFLRPFIRQLLLLAQHG